MHTAEVWVKEKAVCITDTKSGCEIWTTTGRKDYDSEEKRAGICRNLYNGDLYSLRFSIIIIIIITIKLLKYRPIYTLFCKYIAFTCPWSVPHPGDQDPWNARNKDI